MSLTLQLKTNIINIKPIKTDSVCMYEIVLLYRVRLRVKLPI